MTVKRIEKLKTPKFIQQIESTLKPLDFLDRCAKNYGDIFFTNSFGNLETLVLSHPQDIQELFNPTNKEELAPVIPARRGFLLSPQGGVKMSVVKDNAC